MNLSNTAGWRLRGAGMLGAALALLAASMAVPSMPVAAAAGQPGRLPVVASFSILGDMVSEIGGDHVDLHTLVGRDGDAHVYEPSPADARRLAAAQVLVVNGLEFEPWLPRLREAAGFAGSVVVASEGVRPRAFGPAADDGGDHDAGHEGGHDHGHGDDHDHDHDHDHGHDHDHDHGHGHGHDHDDDHGHGHGNEHVHGGHHHHHGDADPHAWQDLANGARYARNIAEGLAAADPGRAGIYRERAQAYIKRMLWLDARLREQFAALPAEQRRVVVSHDAFGYFGDAYGIDFIAVAGVSTQSEASAADMARIIRRVREDKVRAVFVENISSPRLVEQIARETGAKVGGTLYSDALSTPGEPAATYLEMFEWNAKQLLHALQD